LEGIEEISDIQGILTLFIQEKIQIELIIIRRIIVGCIIDCLRTLFLGYFYNSRM